MKIKYYNANPKKWKREGDCVVRAICTVLNQSWELTYMELCELGLRRCMMPNSKLLYEAYLKSKGLEKQKMPKKANGKRYTIREFVEERPDFIGIISVAGHLTCVANGSLIDTWDCSDKSICNYWEV